MLLSNIILIIYLLIPTFFDPTQLNKNLDLTSTFNNIRTCIPASIYILGLTISIRTCIPTSIYILGLTLSILTCIPSYIYYISLFSPYLLELLSLPIYIYPWFNLIYQNLYPFIYISLLTIIFQLDLIHLGAKYGPCMRWDEGIDRQIRNDRIKVSFYNT